MSSALSLSVLVRALGTYLPRVKRTDVMGFRAERKPAPRDALPWGVQQGRLVTDIMLVMPSSAALL